MNLWPGMTGKESPTSLEALRLIRHSFAFSSSKAELELGYQPGDISDDFAGRWNGIIKRRIVMGILE